MNWLKRSLLVVAGMLSFCGSDAPAADAPVKVYILAGQSNMQGHAKVSTLAYMAEDPATAGLLSQMQDGEGGFRTVENTWISYLTQGRGPASGEGVGPLTVGYGARAEPTQAGDTIGPEYTFGLRMQEAQPGPILIIKTAWGGKSLHTDFRPPSAGPYELNEQELAAIEKKGLDLAAEAADRRDRSGVFYRQMVEHVRKVLADPGRVVPGYDAEQGYELAGFVWFQGWNDMVDGSVYSERGAPGSYDAYSELLAAFIRDVRRDLDTPQLPFVIGVMGTNGPLENLEPRYQPIHGEFRRAMAAPASLAEFQGTVIAVQTWPFWDMPLDAVAKQREQLNARKRSLEQSIAKGDVTPDDAAAELAEIATTLASPEIQGLWDRGASNAAYHYFGCGKTMALIGRAFADGLLDVSRAAE
jgi:hypothetical protein